MKETMGQIIRKLRKERNLTQEELAEQLAITFQAVSKWENDIGMPDISQVVPIAHLFGVTTDTLFGNDITDSTEEIRNFIREMEKRISNKPPEGISRFGHRKACCEDVQKMITLYPNHFELICCSLPFIVYLLWDYKDEQFANEIEDKEKEMKAWCNEAIRQANIVLNYCTDGKYLNIANRWLVSIYRIMKDYEKAEEHAMMMTENKHEFLGIVYDDIGRTEDAMKQFSLCFSESLRNLQCITKLGNLYLKQKNHEEAYACFRLIPDIYDLMFKGNENEVPYYINHPCYDWCAASLMNLERYDEAMDWLEKWLKHERRNARVFNVITQSRTPYFYGEDFIFSYNETYPRHKRITPSLEWDIFDPIRKTERFETIVNDAIAFEKEIG